MTLTSQLDLLFRLPNLKCEVSESHQHRYCGNQLRYSAKCIPLHSSPRRSKI